MKSKNPEVKIEKQISHVWKGATLPDIDDPGVLAFSHKKPDQPKVFKALRNKQHVILNAPTGWGKSIVIIFLCLWKLIRHPELRCIIAVPQNVIASGFLRERSFSLLRMTDDWFVGHNLINKAGTCSRMVKFLKGPHGFFQGRILLCAHPTLQAVYQGNKRHWRRLFNNTILWIDEAHHVKNARVNGRKETRSNVLGELVRKLVTSDLNVHVGLATATFMRGDMRHILSEDMEDLFVRRDIPYDQFFKLHKPINHFSFSIVCADYLKGIGELFRQRVCPTIIYLPKRQSQYATKCKHTEVRRIIRQIAKTLRVKARRDGDLWMVGSLKVLDLVKKEGRKNRVEDLMKNKDYCDIIIALDMCKEGFDWPAVQRSIIIGERHSVPEMIQMIGRLFRWSKEKTHAEVFQLLPAIVKNPAKFQKQRNRCLTVVFAVMLLEDILIPSFHSGRKGGAGAGQRLAHFFSDTDTWLSAAAAYYELAGEMDWEESLRHMPSFLNRFGIADKDQLAVWKLMWARFALQTRRQQGLKLDVDFNVLKHTSIKDGVLELTSGLLDDRDFTEWRGRLDRLTPERWVPIAEKLGEEYAAGRAA